MTGALPEGPARELARLLAARLDDREGPAGAAITVAELRRELLPYPRCRQAAGLASKAEYDLAILDLLAEPDVLEVEDPELADAVEREHSAAEPGLGFLEGFAASSLRPGPAVTGGGADGGGLPGGDRPGAGADAAPDRRDADPGGRDVDPGGSDAASGGSDAASGGSDAASGGSDAASGGSDAAPGGSDAAPGGHGDSPGGRDAAPDPSRPPDEPARRSGPDAGDGASTGKGASGGRTAAASCWECGRELPGREGLRYCPWCGADQRSPRCDACREPVDPDWSYCPSCGASVGG